MDEDTVNEIVVVAPRGMPFNDAYFPSALSHAWQAGGRICDFHPARLDEIVAGLSEARRKPPQLSRAQWLVDMSAARRAGDA